MAINDEMQMTWKELAVVSLGNLPFVFRDWEIPLKSTSYLVPFWDLNRIPREYKL
jgi:hypothetical protein